MPKHDPHWLHRDRPESRPLVRAWTDGKGPDFIGDPLGQHQKQAVAELCGAVNVPRGAWVQQVHGGTVLEATSDGCLGEADALWTATPGLAVIGRSADCPLILVGGPTKAGRWVAGFAHASWRSTVRGITSSLLQAMKDAQGIPVEMQAVVCPSAGPCCYEVGPEVKAEAVARLGEEVAAHFHRHTARDHFDLWSANRDQLIAGGLLDTQIRLVGICTICGRAYPSFRRQGDGAGRFAGLAAILSD